jgi:lambda family phage minor tail protein L
MPLPISSWALQEKNKLNTDSVWLIALLITIPGIDAIAQGSTEIRVVRNNEDVEWPAGSGHIWQAFPFELNEISESNKGEVPQVELKIANASRVMERYLQAYDSNVKQYGFEPITVEIYVINSKNLSNAVPEVDYLFELKQPKTNATWATFVLSASNPFNRRFPKNRILKNHCRFKFKGDFCAYSGGESTCDKTLGRCMELNNSDRFGGFPGVGTEGVRLG